jgi:UDP-2-acetamido-2,6-beta-L-arabino-hexul-4-ose reductase
MRVLITGADGFIGRNLQLLLSERQDIQVETFTRLDSPETLPSKLVGVDWVFHLAGVNRPIAIEEFKIGNTGLTEALCAAIRLSRRSVPIIFASSVQAELDNPYGISKRAAEETLLSFSAETGSPVYIYRLPNVFGKWSRPNYNSAIATFCYNLARGLPITINDPAAKITLAYIDDVLNAFVNVIDGAMAVKADGGFVDVGTVYETTVGEIANTIQKFREGTESLFTERVGHGLVRALYSTYVSFLPTEQFSYAVPMHGDVRGVFVEMLKTKDSGQFSYFTAHPGVTRGGHYHHSKTEKFLVIKGNALFKFRHMNSGETHQIKASGEKAEIIETVPGWTHDITNIGDEVMIVMLWANEVFDRDRPDTYACPV